MRRIMLLALLALALPTAALANSTGFTASTGPLNFTLSTSTLNHFQPSNIRPNHPWILNLIGSGVGDTIILSITSLTGCNGQNSFNCPFSGMVTAKGPSVPGGTFTDSLMGTMNRGMNQPGSGGPVRFLTFLTGTLATNPMVRPGSILIITTLSICASSASSCAGLSNGRLLGPNGAGTLHVASPIPEPGTLGLLGTGLFALGGLARRKLKLGT